MADSSKQKKQHRDKGRTRAIGHGHLLARAERCAFDVCRGGCCLPDGPRCRSSLTHYFRTVLDLAGSETIGAGRAAFVLDQRRNDALGLSSGCAGRRSGLDPCRAGAGGFVFAPEALAFQFSRLNPADRA